METSDAQRQPVYVLVDILASIIIIPHLMFPCQRMYMSRGSSFFLGKVTDCLGCAVLLCLVVCLTLLASFFLPSHLSLKHVHVCTCTCIYLIHFSFLSPFVQVTSFFLPSHLSLKHVDIFPSISHISVYVFIVMIIRVSFRGGGKLAPSGHIFAPPPLEN